MGLSGYKGTITFNGPVCSGSGSSGADDASVDEITKFTIVDSVQKKEYGSDATNGWQSACAGVRKLNITIDAMVNSNVGHLQVGTKASLDLYPLGVGCGSAVSGNALIDQVSYTVDIETGLPVSYTATLSSDGEWTGLGSAEWGGFECGCGSESA